MKQPDLVFITKENEERLKKRMKLPDPKPSMTVEEMKAKLVETYEGQEG